MNTRNNTLSDSESTKLTGTQRLLETGLIFTSIFSIYLVVCLLSFDQADPGWSQTAYHADIKNAGGVWGAYMSDILFFTFGKIAFTFPFVLALLGWVLFQRVHLLFQIDFFTLGLKLLGGLFFYIGITAIFSMNFSDIYGFSAGGVVGDYVYISLLPFLNYIGSSLLFLVLTCSGFVLVTGWSVFMIIDYIGEKAIAVAFALYHLGLSLKDKFASAPEKVGTVTAKDPTLANSTDSEQQVDSPLVTSAGKENELITETELEIEDSAQSLFSADSMDSANMDTIEANTFNEVIDEDSSIVQAPSLDDDFVDIDDLMDESAVFNIDEEFSEGELDAAFSNVEKLDVPDDKPVASQSQGAATKGDTPFDKYKGMPTIELLDKPHRTKNPISPDELEQVSRLVEAKLMDYGVQAEVVAVLPGPVITRFELDLAPGVKVSKITNLSKDLARALSAASVRVVEVIPGKSVIGLEIPNKYREMVHLSEVIECDDFVNSKSSLAMVVGKDIAGDPIVADLAKMPHLLVAGTTGSGKSVVVNVMIISMLYKSTPEDVRFIMIDPKMLELSIYEGIPHLLSEVVTDMKDAANALRWCVGEMERRYKLMSALGVRNLKGYNQKIKQAIESGEPITCPLWKPGDNMLDSAPELEKLPSIVVVVDEFADMIMIVGKKVEELIARIAQKARAAGIHLILATQRPSVDVITGLIKANIPTRMALTVSSRVDSRTILDQQGAEQLLGHGDMLYLPQGTSIPLRAQGAFVDDHEVHAVVNDWKSRGKPSYIEEILSGETTEDNLLPGEVSESEEQELDVLYDEALAHVTESRRASISGVQRKFRIGYNRAARLIEQMEASGVVSPPGHNGNREVLAPPPVKN
ncbi:DNA translocase FtsK 4TM domain-containing protein [Thalassotalea aquiviva]|uniref:DNA translocase FtsK n=1 Tax=Thalassotalea aquiviva TaxID=3242415 RepID=UPI003529DC81